MEIDERLAELRKVIRRSRYNDAVCSDIAANIRKYRSKRGLTQKALAELLGLRQPQIARMEREDYRRYTISSLSKIALALEITVDKLVKSVDNNKNIK